MKLVLKLQVNYAQCMHNTINKFDWHCQVIASSDSFHFGPVCEVENHDKLCKSTKLCTDVAFDIKNLI